MYVPLKMVQAEWNVASTNTRPLLSPWNFNNASGDEYTCTMSCTSTEYFEILLNIFIIFLLAEFVTICVKVSVN